MQTASYLEHLRRQINTLRIENHNAQKFIPEDKLTSVLSREAITKALPKSVPVHLREEVIEFVVRGAVKVFGVLILTNQADHIIRFVKRDQFSANQLDYQLPFKRSRLEEILEDKEAADLFYEKQWEISIPSFSGDVAPRILERWTILPYLSETHLATGGYGSVYRLKIHSSYHPTRFHDTVEFVRKELDLFNTTFENEARVLSILQRLRHPNILILVGCYTHKSKHNLISPFVKGGNLRQFLGKPKPPNFSHEELFCSLAGLASAIWALHVFVREGSESSMKGHHQDLRPENILVDDFRFILADFGLSSIKDLSANSRTPFKGRRGYCQAPESGELRHPYTEYEVTRAVDIFAFGCTITDLLAYLLGGPDSVQAFLEAREFHIPPMHLSLFHKGDAPHEVVTQQLDDVADADPRESVQDVVGLAKQMLQLTPASRPDAAEVTTVLYTSTIKAFSEVILDHFGTLPASQDLLIEKSRFSTWCLVYRDPNVFASIFDATTSRKIFESIVNLLRQTKKELQHLTGLAPTIDRRALWELRAVITQLLNMLSSERKSDLRLNLESILITEIQNAKIQLDPGVLDSEFGRSPFVEMTETKKLVELIDDAPGLTERSPFRIISNPKFRMETVSGVKIVELQSRDELQTNTMLVETIQYQDPLTGKELRPRIHALCTLLSSKTLPQQLRIPPFYALSHNETAYCYDLLFNFPTSDETVTTTLRPTSLRSSLTSTTTSNGPPLEERLQLARELTETVAAFHDVSWYHKDLTSSNVLFFSPVKGPPSGSTLRPYLFGFKHSRGATDSNTSGPVQDRRHQRYHHPDYISVNNGQFKDFVPEYDWYSLGIVLLEIGFWSTVDAVMKDHELKSNSDFASILLRDQVNALAFYMGTRYAEIVRFCLTSAAGGRRNSKVQAPNLEFKAKVVFPLQAESNHGRSPRMSNKRKREDHHDHPRLLPGRKMTLNQVKSHA